MSRIPERTRNDRCTLAIGAMIAAISLAACGEIAQDAPKPFAGTDETRSYSARPFEGNQELYEKALERRAQTQDESLRLKVSPNTDAERNAPGGNR